jgi:hypothetical protein
VAYRILFEPYPALPRLCTREQALAAAPVTSRKEPPLEACGTIIRDRDCESQNQFGNLYLGDNCNHQQVYPAEGPDDRVFKSAITRTGQYRWRSQSETHAEPFAMLASSRRLLCLTILALTAVCLHVYPTHEGGRGGGIGVSRLIKRGTDSPSPPRLVAPPP